MRERYRAAWESPGGVAGRLQARVSCNLASDFWQQFDARLGEVTRSDVERVARSYLDPKDAAIVIAGWMTPIAAQLQWSRLPIEYVRDD